MGRERLSVEVLSYTDGIERLIAKSAKLCYSNSNISELSEDLNVTEIKEFIDKLLSMGHESPIEHIKITFGIEGVSRVLTHQLVRHRISSFSQQSQRYVRFEDDLSYIIPDRIMNDEKAREKYINHMDKCFDLYLELTADLMNSGYGEKKAIEEARYVLPNASASKIIVTMNGRSLFNFFRLRSCNRAQKEIRDLSDRMLKLSREISPVLFNNAGPSCVTEGKCSEGKYFCGTFRKGLMVDNYE